jgi:hypothetical protein
VNLVALVIFVTWGSPDHSTAPSIPPVPEQSDQIVANLKLLSLNAFFMPESSRSLSSSGARHGKRVAPSHFCAAGTVQPNLFIPNASTGASGFAESMRA